MLSTIRGLLFYIITFGIVLILGPLVILWSLVSRDYSFPFKSVVWVYGVLFIPFRIKVEITGRENMNPDKAYLFLCNHQSFLDIPVILRIRILSFVSKIEIKKWPLFGAAMERGNCIFVDRSDPESRSDVGPKMLEKMEKNVSYCVFPEGTRSPDGHLLSFRLGIFRIAKSSGLEILPVTICGTYKLLPKRSFKFHPGTIRCVIHKPISPKKFTSENDLMEGVRETIYSALPENLKGR
jgi:1-acyl-sn-glycerol-3-phosphate acyltransferase